MMNTRTNRGWAAVMVAAISMMLAAAIAAPAQTFTSLLDFNGTDGANPGNETLVQGADGSLYGATFYGGPDSGQGGGAGGTLFKVTPSGTLTTIYSFCLQSGCPDGNNPIALVLGSDGSFYGTTHDGGANRSGTVFRITRADALTTLYSFCSQANCADGSLPEAGLVQGNDGNFYGTTYSGGTGNACSGGCGTVFKITPEGTLTTLHSFDVTTGDGLYPQTVLIEAADGNFYGTTPRGGSSASCEDGCGTVFKISPSGTLTMLHSFDSTDGQYPYAALVQGNDGNFYGTTGSGGANSDGTVFKITSAGTLTTLLSFDGTDGKEPSGALVQATDGSFYGTTAYGGSSTSCASGCGTVFEITSGGALTTLHSFDDTDGSDPAGGLVQATSGTLYGTTRNGGDTSGCSNNGCGTVFSLGVGLGPFVETVPSAGNVGKLVTILGNKLTGATSVTFNGTPATFTVESATAIKTTVPAGATTGPVKVVTPSGTLTSNVNFQVLP